MNAVVTSEFKDKVVLVTGGVTNIGREISRAFASAGARLSVNYFSNTQGAESLAEEFERNKIPYLLARGDISDEVSVRSLVEQTIEKFGRIDILINNSAIHRDRVVWKLSSEDWESVLKVDLTAPFMTIREVLPLMRRQQYGRIINISSIVARIGVFGAANYAAAKAGLGGLTSSVALEVANRGVTINVLALGYINLGMAVRLTEENREWVLSRIPVGRFGDIKEVLHVVFFLASRDASYITGQTIHVNGGMYMGG